MKIPRIYLDYAATTPTDPEVIKAMEPYFFSVFGNAASAHSFGQEAKKSLEDSRQTLANFLGAKPEEIFFTSGGTESNNHAIFGIAHVLCGKGKHLIISKVEHHSVIDAARHLEKEGYQISYMGVDKDGLINPDDVRRAITEKTILISIMHANNEIGTIQPLAEIGKIAKTKGIYFHADCVQTVGHLPVDVNALNVDLLSLSAHKFYGPKGVGALYIRKGTKISPLLIGGGQERGMRASTVNLAGIVGLAKAIEICREKMNEENKIQTVFRDKIVREIQSRIEDCFLNGHSTQRLANNVHFSFKNVNGESLLMSLDMIGIAASMGAACTSGALEPSHVLRAIGVSDKLALGSLRVTLGRWTTNSDVDYFLENLLVIVKRLRSL